MKIIVVGAGLVGTSVARALALRGVDVVVIEKGVPGAEASHAAGGILSPQVESDHDGPFLRLCLQGLAATHRLLDQLTTTNGRDARVDVGLLEGGVMDVATTDDEVLHVQHRVQWQRAAGLTATLLDAHETRARVPVLGDVVCAAHFTNESVLEPRALFDLLRADAVRAGAQFVQRRVVRVDDKHVHLVDDVGNAEVVVGDAVVVCAGAWSAQVAGAGVPDGAVVPVRGQMLELQGPKGAFDVVVYGRGGYVVPRVDGRVVAGSTMERAGYDKQLTVQGLARITTMVSTLVPSLSSSPVTSTWAGLRPGTSDGLPLLGRQASGVWVASGHFRNGVLLAAVSGELMVGAILDGVVIDEAFAPSRFG